MIKHARHSKARRKLLKSIVFDIRKVEISSRVLCVLNYHYIAIGIEYLLPENAKIRTNGNDRIHGGIYSVKIRLKNTLDESVNGRAITSAYHSENELGVYPLVRARAKLEKAHRISHTTLRGSCKHCRTVGR